MEHLENPFRPGAGLPPPHLAGRQEEIQEFRRVLAQRTIVENVVLTGLRGVGKTVLLDQKFKANAREAGWAWVGSELDEASSASEDRLATRLLTDLAVLTSSQVLRERPRLGFADGPAAPSERLDFNILRGVYASTPGLPVDKLKAILHVAWSVVRQLGLRGVVFAYDEAQNLANHEGRQEYPLSLLLDTFQSAQKAGAPLMLALVGLPTLFPRLVEARTYAERMFRVISLGRLSEPASREAIVVPVQSDGCPLELTAASIDLIIRESAGYPYFIQFICREVFDAFIQQVGEDGDAGPVPMPAIVKKLDADFFAGRWNNLTDRQRDLLTAVATLEACHGEFTVREVVEASRRTLERGFSSSHANNMLSTLIDKGMVYRNRHGKYSLAVPLLGDYIQRQARDAAMRLGSEDPGGQPPL